METGIMRITKNTELECIVQAICPGDHGKYVVTICPQIPNEHKDGSITFALKFSVWNEGRLPIVGEHVFLSDIYNKNGAWRAGKAKAMRPVINI